MNDPVLITFVLLLGLTLKVIGFAVRDELRLRLLVMTGLVCDAAFYAFRPEPVVQSIMTNSLLFTVNLTLVVIIFLERTTWRMSPEDRALYGHFPTLTPGQFRKLTQLMKKETLEPGTWLTFEGRPVDDLMLVFAEKIEIEKQGAAFPIAGPAFIGEIALLTGRPSSAGVRVPDGGTVVRLPIEPLKGRMDRSPSLFNAMVAMFGQELARKVADSVPMDRAALPRPVAPEERPAAPGPVALDDPAQPV